MRRDWPVIALTVALYLLTMTLIWIGSQECHVGILGQLMERSEVEV